MTIAQQLNIKSFPIIVKDSRQNIIYYEEESGYWEKYEYDEDGVEISFETSIEDSNQ